MLLIESFLDSKYTYESSKHSLEDSEIYMIFFKDDKSEFGQIAYNKGIVHISDIAIKEYDVYICLYNYSRDRFTVLLRTTDIKHFDIGDPCFDPKNVKKLLDEHVLKYHGAK